MAWDVLLHFKKGAYVRDENIKKRQIIIIIILVHTQWHLNFKTEAHQNFTVCFSEGEGLPTDNID